MTALKSIALCSASGVLGSIVMWFILVVFAPSTSPDNAVLAMLLGVSAGVGLSLFVLVKRRRRRASGLGGHDGDACSR